MAEFAFVIEFVGCTIDLDHVDVQGVSCSGNDDGAIQVFISGGTPPVTYSLDGGAFQIQNFFTGLTPGPHQLTIHDAIDCEVVVDVDIPLDPGPMLELIGISSASCGQSNGSIDVKGVGGTIPYSFSIGGLYQPFGVFNNLATGLYHVYLLDANGCADTIPVFVPDDGAPVIDAIIVTNATCGQANGALLVQAGGGAPPLMYSIGGPPQLSNGFSGLLAGTYTVVVTDQNNCEVSQVVQILNTGGPVIDNITTTESICGSNTGIITVFASGGTLPLQYSIDNGPFGSNPVFTGLSAGAHTIAVRDANGCLTNTPYFLR
jgi:hypothetical protein